MPPQPLARHPPNLHLRLCERQTRSGGLNGRPEKLQDVCYSWWCLSALSILGRLHWIDRAALTDFILDCQVGQCHVGRAPGRHRQAALRGGARACVPTGQGARRTAHSAGCCDPVPITLPCRPVFRTKKAVASQTGRRIRWVGVPGGLGLQAWHRVAAPLAGASRPPGGREGPCCTCCALQPACAMLTSAPHPTYALSSCTFPPPPPHPPPPPPPTGGRLPHLFRDRGTQPDGPAGPGADRPNLCPAGGGCGALATAAAQQQRRPCRCGVCGRGSGGLRAGSGGGQGGHSLLPLAVNRPPAANPCKWCSVVAGCHLMCRGCT